MRLTREADYAVLALIFLGARPSGVVTGRPEIAEQLGLSNTFLAKVLRKLTRAGIVRSYPGARGGYALALRPDAISLSAILEAIDGPVTLVRCIDRREPGATHRPFCGCLALEGLARVQTEVTRLLAARTLADLMPTAGHPLRAVVPALGIAAPAGAVNSLKLLN